MRRLWPKMSGKSSQHRASTREACPCPKQIAFSTPDSRTRRTTRLSRKETALGLLFGALIGFYDGIFGPGTGSLLAFIYVRFYAFDFLTAIASSKIINLTTNLAALSFFVPHGHIIWAWALPLAAANLCGGMVGARLAIKGGSRWLRYGFMVLLCVMIGRFGWELWQQ